ncbi:MAG: methylated-DNA--[protein]-cysteine S-methyltransferase [Actinomycetota bacterium]
MTLRTRAIPSPIGELTAVASDVGLRAVLWPEDEERIRFDDELVEEEHPVLDATAAQLDEYFAGERTSFDLPLDLRGTEFQVAAWEALAEIPYGETVSYSEQAERIGRPTAVRAIGAANGKNPVSIVLPCHRVVGADGSLTGFAGGVDAKRALLDHEQGIIRLV